MRRLRSCSLAFQESLNSSVSTLMRLQRKRSVVLGYPVRFSLDPILHDSCHLHKEVYIQWGSQPQRTHTPGLGDIHGWTPKLHQEVHPRTTAVLQVSGLQTYPEHCGAREVCAMCSSRHPTSRVHQHSLGWRTLCCTLPELWYGSPHMVQALPRTAKETSS